MVKDRKLAVKVTIHALEKPQSSMYCAYHSAIAQLLALDFTEEEATEIVTEAMDQNKTDIERIAEAQGLIARLRKECAEYADKMERLFSSDLSD